MPVSIISVFRLTPDRLITICSMTNTTAKVNERILKLTLCLLLGKDRDSSPNKVVETVKKLVSNSVAKCSSPSLLIA